MKPNGALTKGLAAVGTALAWLPIAAPALIAAVAAITTRQLRLDYLMPAELYTAAISGGGLLIWAAIRANTRRRIIGWGFGVAAGSLLISLALFMISALSAGAVGSGNGWEAVVITLLTAYMLALLAIDIGGVLLLRDLFKPARP